MTAGARPEQVATFVGTPYNQGDSAVAVAAPTRSAPAGLVPCNKWRGSGFNSGPFVDAQPRSRVKHKKSTGFTIRYQGVVHCSPPLRRRLVKAQAKRPPIPLPQLKTSPAPGTCRPMSPLSSTTSNGATVSVTASSWCTGSGQERDYRAWPSPHEVALRLSGKFPGGIQLHLPFAQHAVTTVQNRPPDKQPSRQGKILWRQRNGRKGAHVRWAPTSTARSERNDSDHSRTRQRTNTSHRRCRAWD